MPTSTARRSTCRGPALSSNSTTTRPTAPNGPASATPARISDSANEAWPFAGSRYEHDLPHVPALADDPMRVGRVVERDGIRHHRLHGPVLDELVQRGDPRLQPPA